MSFINGLKADEPTLTQTQEQFVSERVGEIIRDVSAITPISSIAPQCNERLWAAIRQGVEKTWRKSYESGISDGKFALDMFEGMYRDGLHLEEALSKVRLKSSSILREEWELRRCAQFVVNQVASIRALKIIDHLGEEE